MRTVAYIVPNYEKVHTMNLCDHKCHQGLGLNPWIDECPICHCANPKYDPSVPPPEYWHMENAGGTVREAIDFLSDEEEADE